MVAKTEEVKRALAQFRELIAGETLAIEIFYEPLEGGGSSETEDAVIWIIRLTKNS